MKNLRTAFLFTLLLLAGCGGGGTGTHVWIDVPVNNLHLTDIQPIKVEGHAASPEGVSLVEVWVNGDLVDSINPTTTSTNMTAFETIFTPASPGEYVIQVIATGRDDTTSTPDTAVVQIGEMAAALADVEEATPTTVPPEEEDVPATEPAPIVSYWADPAEITAGGCTTLYWDITNASRVVFGGRDQELSGSYYDCMCVTQTYPLTVTYSDGTQETFRVTINVSGSCATDTPVSDKTPPDPPTLLKPLNGTTLAACYSDTILRWAAASDSSGIGEYRVQVERHSGDNNWKKVSGSPFTGITGLEKSLSIECGWTYRWRVRAVDQKGNVGDWSGWFKFVDPLT